MSRELVKNIDEFQKAELGISNESDFSYSRKVVSGIDWTIHNGDCVDVTSELSENSIDFSIYSPPFISLYTYSNTPLDMGNSKNESLFFEHYNYLIKNLFKITKEGRNTAVHVSQVPAMLVRDGYIGLKDFRGEVVRHYQSAGWIYHGEIVIQKNPQAQAVRTKSKSLLFVQLKRDSSWLRPGLADYVLLFRKPGENRIPIIPDDISNEDWIKFAHPIWTDIRENHTLSRGEARSEDDEKHICPLQLDVINRSIRLWSNQGDVILSPFAGIGSEGYEAIKLGRKFIGIELKPEYFNVAVKNLTWAENSKNEQLNMFK
jgi:DNA modification methylase